MEAIGLITCSVEDLEVEDVQQSPSNSSAAVAEPPAFVGDDDEELPLVHCGPYDVISEPRKSVSSAAAHRLQQQPQTTDLDIQVIVGSKSAVGDLAASRHTVPAFDDVTYDRFPRCIVIPTTGGTAFDAVNLDEFDCFDDNDDVLVGVESPLPELNGNVTAQRGSRLARRRVAGSMTDAGNDEPRQVNDAEVTRRAVRRPDDESKFDSGDENNDEGVTTEYSRRQFHGGGRFVRYRYPTKFHRSASSTDLTAEQVTYE
jgi:hypothetical protein